MLDSKIKRNDPCTCGSGKKFKKCCGKNEAISITQLLEQEVKALQSQVIDFAFTHYKDEIEKDFEEKLKQLMVEDEDEMDFFNMIHIIWFTLFKPLQDGRTILEVYTDEQGKRIQRTRLKEILVSWKDVQPIAGKILSYSTREMTIQDTLTGESYVVKSLDDIENEESTFLFGIIVPFGQEKIFFTTYFDLESNDNLNDEKFLKLEFEKSGYEDAIQFLKDHFVLLMNKVLYAPMNVNFDAVDWDQPVYQQVAEIFQEEMLKKKEREIYIIVGTILWKQYCSLKQKNIKKPAIYAAAIEYIIQSVQPFQSVTKKGVAESYDVSVASMSKVVNEMNEELKESIAQIKTAIYDDVLESLEELQEIVGNNNVIPMHKQDVPLR